MKICAPAKLYLGFSVLSIILGIIYKVNTAFIIWKIVFAALYTWILSIMCKKRLSELAWAVVLLPFIAIGSMLIYRPMKYKEGLDETESAGNGSMMVGDKCLCKLGYSQKKNSTGGVTCTQCTEGTYTYLYGDKSCHKVNLHTVVPNNVTEIISQGPWTAGKNFKNNVYSYSSIPTNNKQKLQSMIEEFKNYLTTKKIQITEEQKLALKCLLKDESSCSVIDSTGNTLIGHIYNIARNLDCNEKSSNSGIAMLGYIYDSAQLIYPILNAFPVFPYMTTVNDPLPPIC